MLDNNEKTCCICSKKFTGYGNNPWPLREEGVCCDDCNVNAVIPARLEQVIAETKLSEKN